jgi:endoglucanase
MDNKKTLSLVTAGVLSLAMCGTLVSGDILDNTTDVEAVSEMSAIDIVDDMGLGWNLGNTFDSVNTWTNPLTVDAVETGWGNSTTTKEMISTIHDYGFDSIRIPITWWQMMDSDYTINADYLARVKEVVDWCYEEGMYVIINTHHDDVTHGDDNIDSWLSIASSDLTTAQKNYETVWNQIASYFADYDNHLVFEGMNEPSFGTDKVVALNQTFVDTVRATGGNNADRLLLVSAPNTDLSQSLKSDFTLPDDDMIAVSIHYYLPSTFCVAEAGASWGYASTWGTDAEKNELINNFESMKSKFVDNGVPVILGEYGVLTSDENGKDKDSIYDFLKTVAETSKSYDGITSYLWDSGNGGDMQYFNRNELTFFNSAIGQMYIDVNGSDYEQIELSWVETEITTDSKGIVAVNTNGASKIKIEATSDIKGSGTGVIGYWDNSIGEKGSWVQNTVYIRFDTDENGNVVISQTDSDYEEVIHEGYVELPDGADTSSVQVMFFYGGYMDADGNWTTMTDDQYPTLSKAYIPGVASSTDTTQTEATTEAPTVDTEATTTTTAEPTVDTDATTTTTAATDESTVDTTVTTTEDVPADTSETTASEDVVGTDDTSASVSLAEPDFKTLFGYVYPLFSNGLAGQWDYDGTLSDAVAVTGNGDYTLTINIPEGSAAQTIEFLALATDLNKYQQNSDEKEIFSNLSITVNSILVDGEEIAYVASDNALDVNDDGSTYRFSIYDSWSARNVQDIDPNVDNTSSIVINFTIDGIAADGVDTSETSEPETTTADVQDTSDTLDTAASETTDADEPSTEPTGLKGDVNDDNQVNAVDLLTIKKYLLTMIDDTQLNTTNADVNGDNQVNAVDLLKVKKFLLTIIDSLD